MTDIKFLNYSVMLQIQHENSQLGHHTKSFDTFDQMKTSLDADLKDPDFIFEGRSFYFGKHNYHYKFK